MRKYVILTLAGAFAVAGAAETVEPAAAAEAQPRSLEQVRHSALAAMYAGDLQNTQNVYDQRYIGRYRYRGNRKWRGRHWRGRRGHYGRRYYGSRRYYHRRHRGPRIYFGIR